MSISTTNNERFSLGDFAIDRSIERRKRGSGLVYEGDNGLFSQNWWPLCRSSDVAAGAVIGRDFLDGRVAIFRTQQGVASVVSAYCPHNGADLSVGYVAGSRLVCAFHRWEFDGQGLCTQTGSGDPVPPRAQLFRFPTQERYGLIWAFNGAEPLYDLPDLPLPDDQLSFLDDDIRIIDINVDPQIFMCNALDFSHIKNVHKVVFDQEDPDEQIQWSPYRVDYKMRSHFADTGEPAEYDIAVVGTNMYLQSGTAGGRWFTFLFPCCVHRVGTLRAYVIIATRKGDGTPTGAARTREILEFGRDLELTVVGQDLPILNSIRFNQGMLTRSDRALGKFLRHLQRFPRAHPSAEYIA